jgi:hypothetical protein
VTDLAAIQADLEAAEADLAEAQSVERRLVSLRELVTTAESELGAARSKLDDERRDVAALESFSPTRIWAGLRGTRLDDLDREQAEVRAAEYAVAAVELRLRTLRDERAVLGARATCLLGAAERREAALSSKHGALVAAGGATAAELVDIAARRGALEAELREVGEAFDAATAAGRALEEAATLLGKATDWADVDTFLGGGLLTDAMKYDRMDRASEMLRTADRALGRLAKELGDLGRAGVAGPQVTELTRTFDVWFDNIFSDWSVKRRIADADTRTRQAFARVKEVRRSLSGQRGALRASIAALTARRDELLRRA